MGLSRERPPQNRNLSAIFTMRKIYADAILKGKKRWEGRPVLGAGVSHAKVGTRVAFRFGPLTVAYPRVRATVTQVREFKSARAMLVALGVKKLLPEGPFPLPHAVGLYKGLGARYQGRMVALKLAKPVLERGPRKAAAGSRRQRSGKRRSLKLRHK